jgi:predicted ATPase
MERRSLRDHRRTEVALFGRGADVSTVRRLIDEGNPLVTLTGTAGIGKSSLAARIFELHRAIVGDEARIVRVDLEPAQDLADVTMALARALGVSINRAEDGAAAVELLKSPLAHRPALIVLDHTERVTAAVGQAISALTLDAPELQWLVASRERLGLAGEIVHELAPLSVPEEGESIDGSDAVLLWMARVREHAPEHALTTEEAPWVAKLVRKLDGIPLAIELAAARATLLGPRALLARMTERLDVLGRPQEPSAVLAPTTRHATLTKAIDLSWALLTAAERAALMQCSVFRGGFSMEAAEAVIEIDVGECNVFEALQSLRDKSMLTTCRLPAGELRLRLFESVRMFAVEKAAGQADASRLIPRVRDRHAAFFVRQAEGGVRASDDGSKRAADHENVLAALEHLVAEPSSSARLDVALRLLVALDRGAWTHEPVFLQLEQLERVFRASAVQSTSPALRCRGLVARGRLAGRLGFSEASERHLRTAAELGRESGDRGGEAMALATIAPMLARNARIGESLRSAEDARTLARAASDPIAEGWATYALAGAARREGHIAVARARAEEARALFRTEGGKVEELAALSELTLVFLEQGDAGAWRATTPAFADAISDVPDGAWVKLYYRFALAAFEHSEGRLESALELYRESEWHSRAVGQLRMEALDVAYGALVQAELGDFAAARARLGESVPLLRKLSETVHAALFTAVLGAVEASLDSIPVALSLIGAAETELRACGETVYLSAAELCRGHVELAEARDARELGDSDEAARLRASARQRVESARVAGNDSSADHFEGPAASRSFDVRVLARFLERALDDDLATPRPQANDPPHILVEAEGRWFEVLGSSRIACAHRPVMRRLVLALAGAHGPSARSRPAEDLIAEAWPGERILRDAARRRLQVMVSRLRELGLPIESDAEGYRLPSAMSVRFVMSP